MTRHDRLRHHRTRKQRQLARAMQVEGLESRMVMTMNVQLLSGGVLDVTLDANNDVASIQRVGTQLQVTGTGASQQFPLSSITSIQAKSVGGVDQSLAFGPGIGLSGNVTTDKIDSVSFQAGAFQAGSISLTNAETITASGVTFVVTSDISFLASVMRTATTDSSLGSSATAQATIRLSDTSLQAANVTLFAHGTLQVNAEGDSGQDSNRDFSRLLMSNGAVVSLLGGSRVQATGNVVIGAKTSTVASATAEAKSTSSDTNLDAALAVANLTSVTQALVEGSTQIVAGGNLRITAETNNSMTTVADGAANGVKAKGGAVAINLLDEVNEASVRGGAQLTAATIEILATSITSLQAQSKSAVGGATNNDPATRQELTSNNASTADGTISAAAAFSMNKFLRRINQASVQGGSLTSPGAIHIGGNISTSSLADADASLTGSDTSAPAGAGVAVSLGLGASENLAMLGGVTAVQSPSLRIEALTPVASSFSATSKSGAGSGTSLSVAGAFALESIDQQSSAVIPTASQITFQNTAVTLMATNQTSNLAKAEPLQSTSSTKRGLGASYAQNLPTHGARAEVESFGSVVGAQAVVLDAEGAHNVRTEVVAGAQGGTAIDAAVGINVANLTTVSRLGQLEGAMTTTGSVQVQASSNNSNTMTINGNVAGSQFVLGSSLGIQDIVQTTDADVERSLTVAGDLFVHARGDAISNLQALATRAGMAQAQSGSTTTNAQIDRHRIMGDRPSGETKDGAIGGAAATAVNIDRVRSTARIGNQIQISTTGRTDVLSEGKASMRGAADASSVNQPNSTSTQNSVAIAAAINRADVHYHALVDANTGVQAQGVSVESRMPTATDEHAFQAESVSGAASKKVGIAGSFAIQSIENGSTARIGNGSLVHSGLEALQLEALNRSRTSTIAKPRAGGATGTGLGIGSAVAITLADHETIAETGSTGRAIGERLVLGADSSHHTTTEAAGGASAVGSDNALAVTPVIALASVDHTTLARLNGEGVSESVIDGDVSIRASHEGLTATRSLGEANSTGTGVGFSLGLGVGVDRVQASIGALQATGDVEGVAANRGARLAEGRSSVKGSETLAGQTVDSRVDSQRQFLNSKTGDTQTAAPSFRNQNGTMQAAAAIGVQLGQAATEASVAAGANVRSLGKLSLIAQEDVDSRAKADASTVGVKTTNGLGIGGAASANRVETDTRATIGANASVQALGVQLETQMLLAPAGSLIPADTSGVGNAGAESISGAGTVGVGIAGAFAIDVAQYQSTATIGNGAVVDAGEGSSDDDVVVRVLSKTLAKSDAKVAVTGNSATTKVGIGAGIAYNADRSRASALVGENSSIVGADDVQIEATADRTSTASAQAGAQGGTSVAPGVAIAADNATTEARLAAGPGMIADGNVSIRTSHVGRATSTAQANADGNKVAVGTIAPITVQVSETSAKLERNVTATGDIRAVANSDFQATSNATASAVGANLSNIKQDALINQLKEEAEGLLSKDTGEDFRTRLSSSLQKISGPILEQLDKATDQVSVAAAIGVNIATTLNEATVPTGVVLSAGGNVAIESLNRNQVQARSLGGSVSAGAIGVASAVNVVDSTQLAAFRGASMVGNDLSIQAANPIGQTDTITAQAGSAAGGAQNNVGIGSLALNIIQDKTEAKIGGGSLLQAGGEMVLRAEESLRPQALAGGIALGRGEGTGASLAGNVINDTTTALIESTSAAKTRMLAVESLRVSATHDLRPFNGASPIDPLSLAIGGLTNGENSKVGSLSADVIGTTTIAESGIGAVWSQSGIAPTGQPGLALMATDTTQILSGAGTVTVSDAKGKNFGGQLEILNKEVRAQVGTGASFQSAGRMDIAATSQENVTTFASSVAVTNGNNFGGTATVLLPNVTTVAQMQGGNQVQALGGLQVLSTHSSDLKPTAGTLGFSNERSIGTAAAVTVVSDRTESVVGAGSGIQAGGAGVKVSAGHVQNLRPLAIGGTLSGGNGLAGTSTVSVLNSTTRSHVDQGSSVSAQDSGIPSSSISVLSSSQQTVQGGQGSVNIGTSGFGAGADVLRLNGISQAWVEEGTQLQAERDVVVDAKSQERTLAISGAVQVANSVGIGGAADVQNVDINTQALLGRNPQILVPAVGSTVFANNNVIVTAHDAHDADLIAATANVSGNGAGGAVTTVSSIQKTVLAEIANRAVVDAMANGPLTNAASGLFSVTTPNDVLSDTEVALPNLGSVETSLNFDASRFGRDRVVVVGQSGVRGVRVAATQLEKLETIAVGGAVGTLTGNLSAPINVVTSNVSAVIGGNASINAAAGGNVAQNVEVLATSDTHLLEVSGGAGFAGTGSVLPGATVGVVKANTTAVIGDGANVRAVKDVDVLARGSEDVMAVTAGVGIAGSLGVAGAVSVTTIDNRTTARVGQGASVFAGEDVRVLASDDTAIVQVNGAVAIGVAITGVGGSVGVVRVQKETESIIDDLAQVDATGGASSGVARVGGVSVNSVSQEKVTNVTAAGGGGFIGVAGSVNSLVIDSDTRSRVEPQAKINTRTAAANAGQDVVIDADNRVDVRSFAGGVAIGVGTGAGGVDVGTIRNDTTAIVEANAEVRARSDVEVDANSRRTVKNSAVSGGAGAAGLAGAVSVWAIGTKLDPNYSNGSSEGSVGTVANALADNPNDGGGVPQDEFADKFAHRQIEKVRDRLLLNLNAYAKPAAGDTTPNANQRVGVEALQARNEVSQNLATQSVLDGSLNDGEQATASLIPTGVAAIARAGSVVNANQGNVVVQASDMLTHESTAGQAGLALASLGGAINVVQVAQKVTALLEGTAEAGGAISVEAIAKGGANDAGAVHAIKALSGQAGLVGLGAAVVAMKNTSNVQATVASTANVPRAGSMTVLADAVREMDGETRQALLTGLSAGASFVKIEDRSQAKAQVQGRVGQDVGKVVGSLTIDSDNISRGSADVAALTGGIGSGSANFINMVLVPVSQATLSEDAKVVGSVVLDAKGVATIGSRSKTGAIVPGATIRGIDAGGATIGASRANTATRPLSDAMIQNANVDAGQDIVVRSNATATNFAEVEGAAGAIVGTGLTHQANVQVFSDAGAKINTATESSTHLKAGRDLVLDATSDSESQADVGIRAGSVITSVGRAEANSDLFSEASSSLSGDGFATMVVGRDALIGSRTSQRGEAIADSFGVSAVPDAKSTANSNVDFASRVLVGNVEMEVANRLVLDAGAHLAGSPTSQGTDSRATASARGIGAGTDSDAIANANIGFFPNTANGASTGAGAGVAVDVQRGADLQAQQVQISAHGGLANAVAKADPFDTGVFVSPDATARARMSPKANVNLGLQGVGTASVRGDQSVSLNASWEGLSTDARAVARDSGGTVASNAVAVNTQTPTIDVTAGVSSVITTRDLDVDAKVVPVAFQVVAQKDTTQGPENQPTVRNFNPVRTIHWDGDVNVLAAANPILEIDANGVVTRGENVSIVEPDGTLLGPVSAPQIVVRSISHVPNATPIHWEANALIPTAGSSLATVLKNATGVNPLLGQQAFPAAISGFNSQVTYEHALEGIRIANASTKDVVLGSMNPISTLEPQALIEDLNESNFNFQIRHGFQPTSIEVENTSVGGSPDLLLGGSILNPIGTTELTASRGDIFSVIPRHLVQTQSAVLSAPLGSIGEVGDPITLDMVQASSVTPKLTLGAQGDARIQLSGRLRDNANTVGTPTIAVEADVQGLVDLQLATHHRDQVEGNPLASTVREVRPPLGDKVTTVFTRFHVPVEETMINPPLGVFGSGNTPVAGKVVFEGASAGSFNVVDRDTIADQVQGSLTLKESGSTSLANVNSSALTLQGGAGNNLFLLNQWGGSVSVHGGLGVDQLRLDGIAGSVTTLESMQLLGPVSTRAVAPSSLAGSLEVVGNTSVVVADTSQVRDLLVTASLTGAGSLDKSGLGSLVLTQNSPSFQGTLRSLQGSLFTHGTMPSTTVVGGGGSFFSDGVVKTVQAATSPSTLGAGDELASVGRMTVQGAFQPGAFSTLAYQLNGTAAGTTYDTIVVNGPVSLGGATLQASLGFASTVGTVFTLIANDGTDPVVGTFAGLPQGSVLTVNGVLMQVSYTGGTGNDVTLTRVNSASAFAERSLTAELDENGVAILRGRIVEADAGDAFQLTINWGDGTLESHEFPAGTRDVVLSHRYLDNAASGGSYRVDLAWQDPHGGGRSDFLMTTVKNVAPQVSVGGDRQGVPGQTLQFALAAMDPSSVDVVSGLTYEIAWGDGSVERVRGGSSVEASHVYAASGLYGVEVVAIDKDGGRSPIAARSVRIDGVQLQAGVLRVGGTAQDDVIELMPVDAAGTIAVVQGGVVLGIYHPTERIEVYAQGGDDRIRVKRAVVDGAVISVQVPIFLFGGAGNDWLDAAYSGGSVVLVGGEGDDHLVGGTTRDLLIGGGGLDTLRGQGGQDILIGESTRYDDQVASLNLLMAEWVRSDIGKAARMNHLSFGGGLNGTNRLDGESLLDDGLADDVLVDLADWRP